MSELRDRIVLITGASSGLGAGLARELVARGARVGLLARREEHLRALATELGDAAAWAEADVTDAEGFAAALDRLADELGGCDVVIANAGYGVPNPSHRFRPGVDWAMYDTNVGGTLRLFDWAIPRFLERGEGHLVGVASMASYVGMPGMAAYCGTKAAMRVHLQGLRAQMRPWGIAVTTICPGFVETELTEKNKGPMPFLWPTGRAVRLMADAIEERRGDVPFPWQMRLLIGALVRLPTAVTDALVARTAAKKRPLASD